MTRIKRIFVDYGGTLSLLTILTVSLSANVWLGLGAIRAAQPRIGGIQQGQIIPSLPVTTPDGQATTLTFVGQRPTILYVLSPECSWCQRNEANIVELARAKARDFRVIGVSVGRQPKSLAGYLKRHPLPFEVFQLASEELGLQLGFTATPQTAIVDDSGRATRVWVGAYLERSNREIAQVFGVTLPGLMRDTPPAR